MFFKKTKGEGFPLQKTGSGSVVVKYSKPKILLMDMGYETEDFLKKEGYNVAAGSFGTPYNVEKSDSYLPVIRNGKLPFNLSEQEIIVINLWVTSILNKPLGNKETPPGENDWWASCSVGLIDPRPRLMASVQDDFERIYSYGGVFIVFADSKVLQNLIFARIANEGYGKSFRTEKSILYDNWSFLKTTDYITVNSTQGEEIIINDGSFNQILSEHVKGAIYRCTISSEKRNDEHFQQDWTALAKNKFGGIVAYSIISKIHKGLILIFPQLNDKPHFLAKLFNEILPDLSPHLFPHLEGILWTQRPEYEHPKVLDLKYRIEEVLEEARKRAAMLEKDIDEERAALAFLHELITGTDKALVKAVKKTLEVLGFKNVADVDEEMEKIGDKGAKREDLQIHDDTPTLLIEVKGISGIPKDAAALQGWKYVAPRMKEWDRTDVQALSIIDHQRKLPPLERDNRNCFREDIIINAEEHGFGLLTTWDLFRLTRSYLKNGWNHQNIKPLFYQHGRIDAVPRHYEFVGEVEDFWEKVKAVGVRLKASELKVGDRIAFELPVEFEEQDVESLQVEKEIVSIAKLGNLAGILTHFTKDQARKGVRVFRVKNKG
jgi:hypothetical protein